MNKCKDCKYFSREPEGWGRCVELPQRIYIYPCSYECPGENKVDVPPGFGCVLWEGRDGGRGMSYSIWSEIDTGAGNSAEIEIGNYTSNVSCMWNDALPDDITMRSLKGVKASDALPHLRTAVDAMEVNVVRYREMEPSNGWGDYEGALGFLDRLKRKCIEHPNCVIRMFA